MAEPRRIITPAEMDKMTPQERADAVTAGIVRDLGALDPAFRARVEERARTIAESLPANG
jgi:hypothetical protein